MRGNATLTMTTQRGSIVFTPTDAFAACAGDDLAGAPAGALTLGLAATAGACDRDADVDDDVAPPPAAEAAPATEVDTTLLIVLEMPEETSSEAP